MGPPVRDAAQGGIEIVNKSCRSISENVPIGIGTVLDLE